MATTSVRRWSVRRPFSGDPPSSPRRATARSSTAISPGRAPIRLWQNVVIATSRRACAISPSPPCPESSSSPMPITTGRAPRWRSEQPPPPRCRAPRKSFSSGASLSAMVTRLQRAGHQVALVQAIPHWSQQNRWDPVDCSAASLVLVRGGCDATVSLVSSEQQDGATRAAIASLAEAAGVGVIDPGPTMCPSGTCSVRGPGFIRLSDSGHISAPQSRALAPLFADVIGRSRTR